MRYLGEKEINGIATQTPIIQTAETTVEMKPNVFYEWTTEIETLTITLGSQTSGIVNEFMGTFTTGATLPTVTFPSSVVWQNGTPTILQSSVYEFSIINNHGVITKM